MNSCLPCALVVSHTQHEIDYVVSADDAYTLRES